VKCINEVEKQKKKGGGTYGGFLNPSDSTSESSHENIKERLHAFCVFRIDSSSFLANSENPDSFRWYRNGSPVKIHHAPVEKLASHESTFLTW
jgi:hypothetical protein